MLTIHYIVLLHETIWTFALKLQFRSYLQQFYNIYKLWNEIKYMFSSWKVQTWKWFFNAFLFNKMTLYWFFSMNHTNVKIINKFTEFQLFFVFLNIFIYNLSTLFGVKWLIFKLLVIHRAFFNVLYRAYSILERLILRIHLGITAERYPLQQIIR